MRVERVTVEKAAHQYDFWREQVQPGCDRLGVFAEDARAFFDDLHHTRVTLSCGFKHHRRQHCDVHFVRCLHPANQFIKIVQ